MAIPVGHIQIESLTDAQGRVIFQGTSLTGGVAPMVDSAGKITTVSSPVTMVASGLFNNAGFGYGCNSVTSTPFSPGNYTFFYITTAAVAFTGNLPTAVGIRGRMYIFKKIDAGAGTVTITPAGAETIDGAPNYVLLAQNNYVAIVNNNANWFIIAAG